MRLLSVHGIHASVGDRDPCDPLIHDLVQEYDVDWVDIDYGYFTAWDTTIQEKRAEATDRLMYEMRPGDHIIAHSFGCWVVHDCLWRMWSTNKHLGEIFFFAPALAADVLFPKDGYSRVHVVYNRHDKAIGLGARAMQMLGSTMGLMGRNGAALGGSRVLNVNAQHNDGNSLWDHETFTTPHFRRFWVDYIGRAINAKPR